MCLDFAPAFCVLLFACTSHLMLYTAQHNEYMSTAVFNYLYLFICNVSLHVCILCVLYSWDTLSWSQINIILSYLSLKEKNQDKYIQRRIMPGWAACAKHRVIFKSNLAICLCATSYDIWCRDLDTDQTSTEQTCGRTGQNGKKYAQHRIQR